MFSVLIPSNVYIECDLSSINCLHHRLHQIYLLRTASIPTEAAAKIELHKKKKDKPVITTFAQSLFLSLPFLSVLGETSY